MKKNTKKRILSILLSFILCFGLSATSVMAADNTISQARAGGGSTAKYVYAGEASFTFPVQGSGMHTIRIEISGTTNDNTAYVTVTPPGREVPTFAITGNNTASRYFITSLPAGTYSVYAYTYNSAVIAVYVE